MRLTRLLSWLITAFRRLPKVVRVGLVLAAPALLVLFLGDVPSPGGGYIGVGQGIILMYIAIGIGLAVLFAAGRFKE